MAYINATALAQEQVQKNVNTGRRLLRNPAVPRSLQDFEAWTGSKLALGIHVEFEYEPVPHTNEVNEAMQHIWIEESSSFLNNLHAEYTCASRSRTTFFRRHRRLPNKVCECRDCQQGRQWVKSTVDQQRILFSTKAIIDACRKQMDHLDEISEMRRAKPIKRKPST